MTTLRNGKPIEEDMLELAMEDSNMANRYYLNMLTGEVLFLSEYDDPDKSEKQLEEIEGSSDYTPIERIASPVAYQWMVDFVATIVEPKDEHVAEKLSIALMGKGAFRRFKDVLYILGDEWVQTWYRWKEDRLKEVMDAWLKSVL